MYISKKGSTINGIDFPGNLNIYASKPIIGTSLISSIGKIANTSLKILSYIGYILGSILTVGLLALCDHIIKGYVKADIVFAAPGNTKCVYLNECAGNMPYRIYDDKFISNSGLMNTSTYYINSGIYSLCV